MRAEYKRDMNHNYLILYGDKEIDTASYQVRMLVGNAVHSLLKCRVQGIDGKFMIYYDITSRQPVSTLYEQRKFGLEDLRMIFGGFVQVMEEMSEYLLNPGELVIRPEYIYMDAEKKELLFCYLPGFQKDVREQFQELTEYVLPKLDHEDGKAVMLGYGVYRRALEDSFHLEHIKEDLYHVQDKSDVQDRGDVRDKAAVRGQVPLSGISSGEKDAKHLEMMDGLFRREENGHTAENWESSGAISGVGRTGNKYSVKSKEGLSGSGHRSKNGLWKWIIGSAAGIIILMSVISAKLLGYLPGIGIESILGGVLVCMGVGMLIYKICTRKRKDQAEAVPVQKSQMEDFYREPEHKKTEMDKGYLYRRDFELEEDEKEIYDSQEQDAPPESCGETVILSENPVAGPASLVSREPGELATIYLKDELTVIGKLETAADAVINLPTVSRVHAKIRKKDGAYYLSDLNSRNGTSVNGRILKSEEEYRLEDQDEVDFAQAGYVFLE